MEICLAGELLFSTLFQRMFTKGLLGPRNSVNNVCVQGYFPGGPVAKTPRSQSRGPGFDSWSGN